MGSWDYYCALCGAGFSSCCHLPSRKEFKKIRQMIEQGREYDNKDSGAMDPLICSYESIAWLEPLRILGHNPHGTVGRGVFLSGLGDSEDYGSWIGVPGDHPNVLKADGPQVRDYYSYTNDGEKLLISVYTDLVSYIVDLPLPFHDRCFQMLRRTISGDPDGDIDLDALYEALGTKRGGTGDREDPRPFNNSCLFLDYYQFKRIAREQFWGSNPGLEPWYNDPVDIPAIPKLLNGLPSATKPPEDKTSNSDKDPFARLPLELLVEVILELPRDFLLPFFLASRAARLASRSQWVWKKRIEMDMPWLWELDERKEYSEEVDWQAVYWRLVRLIFADKWKGLKIGKGGITPEQRLDLDLSGLASRYRIWKCCEQVRELYENRLSELSAEAS